MKRPDNYKQRRKKDRYQDLNMLPDDTRDGVVFFGGKHYGPLFAALTKSIKAKRTVFYNSLDAPEAPGCTLRLFDIDASTNWQYFCANALLNKTISAD